MYAQARFIPRDVLLYLRRRVDVGHKCKSRYCYHALSRKEIVLIVHVNAVCNKLRSLSVESLCVLFFLFVL